MNPTKIYPLDTATIHKGDLIPVATLQEIVKSEPGKASYAFRVMKLKAFIAKAMALRGEPATLVIRKNEIHVLTDAEANEYNFSFANSGARRIRRSRARHAVIDLSKLTPDQRKDWDRNAAKLALMTTALSLKKLPEVQPHKRIE